MRQIVYIYDNLGYYQGTDTAFNNILPVNSTYVKPDEKEGYIPKWDGAKWSYVENYKGEEGYVDNEPTTIKEYGPYPKGWSKDKILSITELATIKKNQANSLRFIKEREYFVWDGSKFDSSTESISRLLTAQSSIKIRYDNGDTTPKVWTLYDNTTRVMTLNDFSAVIGAFDIWSDALHSYVNVLKNKVDDITTDPNFDDDAKRSKLNDLNVEEGWPVPEDMY